MKSSFQSENQYLRAWILFRRVHDILFKIRNRELTKHRSNVEKTLTLQAIKRLGKEATPNNIAKTRYRRPNTISVLLKNMEAAGLVTRSKDLSRKNVIRISLTEKGKEAIVQTRKSGIVNKIFSPLSHKELTGLLMCLDILCSEAEQNYALHFGNGNVALPEKANVLFADNNFRKIVTQTKSILANVSNAVTGALEVPWKDRTEVNHIRECLSTNNVGQLLKYLSIIRNQLAINPGHKKGEKPVIKSYTARKLEQIILYKLTKTHDLIFRIREKELFNHNFSIEVSSALSAVQTLGDKATVGEIARWRLRSVSTVSKILTKMESQGLVAKRPYKPESKRSRMILTKKGKGVLKFASAGGSLTPIFSSLSQKDLIQFVASLETIHKSALEEYKTQKI